MSREDLEKYVSGGFHGHDAMRENAEKMFRGNGGHEKVVRKASGGSMRSPMNQRSAQDGHSYFQRLSQEFQSPGNVPHLSIGGDLWNGAKMAGKALWNGAKNLAHEGYDEAKHLAGEGYDEAKNLARSAAHKAGNWLSNFEEGGHAGYEEMHEGKGRGRGRGRTKKLANGGSAGNSYNQPHPKYVPDNWEDQIAPRLKLAPGLSMDDYKQRNQRYLDAVNQQKPPAKDDAEDGPFKNAWGYNPNQTPAQAAQNVRNYHAFYSNAYSNADSRANAAKDEAQRAAALSAYYKQHNIDPRGSVGRILGRYAAGGATNEQNSNQNVAPGFSPPFQHLMQSVRSAQARSPQYAQLVNQEHKNVMDIENRYKQEHPPQEPWYDKLKDNFVRHTNEIKNWFEHPHFALGGGTGGGPASHPYEPPTNQANSYKRGGRRKLAAGGLPGGDPYEVSQDDYPGRNGPVKQSISPMQFARQYPKQQHLSQGPHIPDPIGDTLLRRQQRQQGPARYNSGMSPMQFARQYPNGAPVIGGPLQQDQQGPARYNVNPGFVQTRPLGSMSGQGPTGPNRQWLDLDPYSGPLGPVKRFLAEHQDDKLLPRYNPESDISLGPVNLNPGDPRHPMVAGDLIPPPIPYDPSTAGMAGIGRKHAPLIEGMGDWRGYANHPFGIGPDGTPLKAPAYSHGGHAQRMSFGGDLKNVGEDIYGGLKTAGHAIGNWLRHPHFEEGGHVDHDAYSRCFDMHSSRDRAKWKQHVKKNLKHLAYGGMADDGVDKPQVLTNLEDTSGEFPHNPVYYPSLGMMVCNKGGHINRSRANYAMGGVGKMRHEQATSKGLPRHMKGKFSRHSKGF